MRQSIRVRTAGPSDGVESKSSSDLATITSSAHQQLGTLHIVHMRLEQLRVALVKFRVFLKIFGFINFTHHLLIHAFLLNNKNI